MKQFDSYTREKFVMETQPGMFLLGYLLILWKGSGPHPTMICVPGHGRGVDNIVGVDDKGRDRTDKAGYRHDFGCRRDPANKKQGLGTSSCQPNAGAALLFGETMIGWRV